MMIEALANRWAIRLKNAVPDHPASVAVLRFALQLFIETVLTLIVAILISLFTGRTLETLLVLIAFGILRAVSGGFHFKTPLPCILSTSIGANLVAFADFNQTAVLAMTGTSLLLAAVFAPSKIENQTRIPKKYYPALKVISIAIIAVNFLVQSSILAATFLIQSLTLIRKRR